MKNKKIKIFLIGAQKAGSTTLYSWLSQHPELDAPESIKDFHFFNSDEYFRKGYQWLESLYNKSNTKIKINGAVNYIFRPELPKKIFEYNDKSKFIVVLRDPVKRAFSAYQYFKKLNKEERSFELAIKEELDNKFESWEEKDDFAYLEHGYYFKQLQNWFQYFDEKNFIILTYEDLFLDPKSFLPKIFSHIGVKDIYFMPELHSKNISGSVKYKKLNKLVYSRSSILKKLPFYLKLKNIIPMHWRGNLKANLKDWNTKKGGESEKITKEDYEQLNSFFKEDSSELSLFLKINLNEQWKY